MQRAGYVLSRALVLSVSALASSFRVCTEKFDVYWASGNILKRCDGGIFVKRLLSREIDDRAVTSCRTLVGHVDIASIT